MHLTHDDFIPYPMNQEDCLSNISTGDLRRGLRLSVASSAIGMIYFTVVLSMPFQMMLEALGASGFMIGLFGTLRQLVLVSQIPGSLLIESLKRRKPAWATLAISHRLLLLIPAWLAWRQPNSPDTVKWILAAVAFSFLIEGFAAPSWTSWMADLVPPALRGRFWGQRQALVNLVSLITIAIAGLLLDHYRRLGTHESALTGFAIVMFGAVIFGVVDILMHIHVPEPLRERGLPGRNWMESIVVPLRDKSFRNLALSVGVWGFACSAAGSFNSIYMKRVFNVNYSELAAVIILSTIGIILFSILAGYLIERMGARTLSVVVMCLAPLFSISWFLVTDAPVVLNLGIFGQLETTQVVVLITLVSLFSGGVYSMITVCHLAMLSELAPKRGRTLAIAVHMCLIGLLTAIGTACGGKVVDYITAHPFSICLSGSTLLNYTQVLHTFHAVVIWTVALPLLLSVRTESEPLSIAEGFHRIVLVNPLRLIIGVYQAQALNAPSRRRRRLRAATAMGDAGAAITTSDLIRRLDDPVLDVREAAALSLGRIGGRTAHEALLAKINDSESDLTLVALRALRSAPSPELSEALLPLLGSAEPYVVREVVRTLGACGNRVAVAPLVEMLNRTPRGPLVAITAEVLGHFGDVSSIFVVLPRFRLADNEVRRNALAVACGDLLGTTDGFYRLLSREEASAGAGIAYEVARVRRRLLLPWEGVSHRERYKIRRELALLEAEMEAGELQAAALRAFAIAEKTAFLRYRIVNEGETADFLTKLGACNETFMAGVWYLAVIKGEFSRFDASGSLAPVQNALEMQLAIHVVASWFTAGKEPD